MTIPTYRIYCEPAGTGIVWVVINESYFNSTLHSGDQYQYPAAWRVLSYKQSPGGDVNGCPRETFQYIGRTIVCPSVLEALNEAANPVASWNTVPLPEPYRFELVAYGDGEGWVLVTMHPDYGNAGNLRGWHTRYHPNTYDALQYELQTLGVPMPKHLEHMLEGEMLTDLSPTMEVPQFLDFPELTSKDECAKHALDALNAHYFCIGC